VIPDKHAEKEGDSRIIDESGEDYLDPGRYFAAIEAPRETERALKDAFEKS
jgi:hypothetical protein